MKCFLRSQRVLPLASGVLLVALVAVSLVSWSWGRSAPHALADSTTWTPVSGLPANSGLFGIACPNAGGLLCVAVGYTTTNSPRQGEILTTPNGTTWTPVAGLPAAAYELDGIACPNAGGLLCVAVGQSFEDGVPGAGPAVILTTPNGTTWTPIAGLPANSSLYGIACPNVGDLLCVAVGRGTNGSVILTTPNGTVWTPIAGLPAGGTSLTGIACPNAGGLLCVAMGGTPGAGPAVILTTPNGTTWTPIAGPPATNLIRIACPNTEGLLCVAVGANSSGQGVILTTPNGTVWTPVAGLLAQTPLIGIACPNVGSLLCVAVGGPLGISGTPGVILTTPNGTVWTPVAGLPIAFGLFGIACPNVGGLLCATVGISSNNQALILFSSTVPPPDTTPPVLSEPGTLTIDATSPQGVTVTYTVTASDPDNPADQLTITCSPASGSTFPIGTTTVTCTASDPAGNSATGSFLVVVKGAATQTSDLITTVNDFNLSFQGIQTSLDSQLQAVQADLAANNTAQACSDLTSFINHVNAQSGKHLTTDQANQLLAAATNIGRVLGC